VELLASRRYKRYLRLTKNDLVRIDRGAIRRPPNMTANGSYEQNSTNIAAIILDDWTNTRIADHLQLIISDRK